MKSPNVGFHCKCVISGSFQVEVVCDAAVVQEARESSGGMPTDDEVVQLIPDLETIAEELEVTVQVTIDFPKFALN